MAQNQETEGMNQEYFDEMSGVGMGDFTPDTISTAYLSMVQPSSSAEASHTPGTWRNSATDTNYGPSVKVIPLAFKTVWTERDPQTFITLGRYEPHSITVQTTYPKPGQRGFPTMINPVTGNKVEELFLYAVLLPEHPEDGVLYFGPTASSMKTCKQWNTMIKSAPKLIRKDGTSVPAGICSYVWELYLELVQNPKRANEKICKFTKVTREYVVPEKEYADSVRPQLVAAQERILLAAPAASGDAEGVTEE